MDNLTHTLTGLMLSRVGLSTRIPWGPALLMVASNAPDIDIVTAMFGSHVYLDHHRGITHSLFASPFLAALCVGLWGFWRREGFPWLRAWLGAWAAVLTHLMWDWTNIYGIRLLEPFSNVWLRLDWVSVVDPLVWAALLVGTLWPLLGGLVNSEIGARGGRGRGTAGVILILLTVYVGARAALHARALATIDSHIYEEGRPVRTAAFPDFLNPFEWIVLVEHPASVRISRLALNEDFDPMAGRVWYRGSGQHKAARLAAATAPFQAFLRFSAFPYWTVSQIYLGDYDAFRIEACDLRFGAPGEGRFTVGATIDRTYRVVDSEFQFSPKGRMPRPR